MVSGFDTPLLPLRAIYIGFEFTHNINFLWGFGGCWRFLIGAWNLDLDLDMASGLGYNHDPNLDSLY